eukprot:CAMPEP_0168560564 /NCGR_PEP_ID=MMETSP0413-20121227/11128_1 /TAXON_ID=136452 /ORGANISM="Filamoeba nolandi, Strain NC-AS-23-1" /LENGTH=809 /DNA_ID=CAMNT_0008591875 /DNA_START=69 /DNA_END=2498 /DNA_ORIENTATION=+
MSKNSKSTSAKTQQHIEETAYINSVLSPTANSEGNTVNKTTIELVKNVTKWPEEDILRVLKDSGNDPQLAINKILDGSAGKPTQWTEVQGKHAKPKAETKPTKQNKPANGSQNRDGGGKTQKSDEKREDRNKREARKRPQRNAPGTNQEPSQQQSAQPQAEVKQKEPEVQTNQVAAQNVATTASAPSQSQQAVTKSSKENGTPKPSVSGWGKPPASIYTDSHQNQSPPAIHPMVSQPISQTQPVATEPTTVANLPTSDKPKQDNLPRWGPQSKSLQNQTAQPTQASPTTTPQNANASSVSSSTQSQSSAESQLAEVQPAQTSQATNQANQSSKSSPSVSRQGPYNPPIKQAWKPKDAPKPTNDQPQTVPAQSSQPAAVQPAQVLPQVPATQTQPQTQPTSQSQPQPTKTPTTTPTNKPSPVTYSPVVTERSAVILPPSSVALIGGNTQDVHFGVFGSTFTEATPQQRTEPSRTTTAQYQPPAHTAEVSHAHAHPHADRLGVEHLHIAEAYSPDHQAPQIEDPHANQIPPYFLHPSYVPTFAPPFTYETDPSLRAMHVYDPNQVQSYQHHNVGYQQGIPDSKYGENNYTDNKYGSSDTPSTQNPQGTQSQGPQTQPQHPAYYSSPIYPYPYPPNQYSFQNPSVTPSQYLPPRFYQRPFPANYPGNSTYLQPAAPTGVQPVGATHAYPGAEEQDVYKPPVQFSVPMNSYFMPPEANPSMLGKPAQSTNPKGQSQVNYAQGNPSSQTTEQSQAFKTTQTYQPGNNPRESYYNMQQPQYGQVQGQSNYAFVPPVQTQVQPQVQSQPFPRSQYQ